MPTKTLVTGSDTYCPVAEFLNRTEERSVGDWVSVDGTRVLVAALATDPKVLAALRSASGYLESVALLGGRYTPTDLAALTGNAQALLYQIVSQLARMELWQGRRNPKPGDAPPQMTVSVFLDKLANGERIFGFQEVMDAGRFDVDDLTNADEVARNGLVYQADRYFGDRTDRRMG